MEEQAIKSTLTGIRRFTWFHSITEQEHILRARDDGDSLRTKDSWERPQHQRNSPKNKILESPKFPFYRRAENMILMVHRLWFPCPTVQTEKNREPNFSHNSDPRPDGSQYAEFKTQSTSKLKKQIGKSIWNAVGYWGGKGISISGSCERQVTAIVDHMLSLNFSWTRGICVRGGTRILQGCKQAEPSRVEFCSVRTWLIY